VARVQECYSSTNNPSIIRFRNHRSWYNAEFTFYFCQNLKHLVFHENQTLSKSNIFLDSFSQADDELIFLFERKFQESNNAFWLELSNPFDRVSQKENILLNTENKRITLPNK
jgi:hypothetical protein